MAWFYYILAAAIVLILAAFWLHSSLYRSDAQQDSELNRLIDERIERLGLGRKKDD